MRFYNIKDKKETASFSEAVLQGAAGGNGLFFPVELPEKERVFFDDMDSFSFTDLATEVLHDFVMEDFAEDELQDICARAFNFSLPLVWADSSVYSLELFHGPSLAFKDVGARFLAEVLKKIADKQGDEITVLVATSGDTGSAVARSFYHVPGIRVVLLYPSGKVSPLQEKTLTTLGGNITAVEVQGTFDDCQNLVKQAFADRKAYGDRVLTSANSINVGRLLPQMVYYFWAWRQLEREQRRNMIFSVPSGNYGNLSAGVMAWKMGLPVKRFIAASNINRVVPDYLETGLYKPRSAVRTYSNAMDVGDPSNFVRIREMFDNDHQRLSGIIQGFVADDQQTSRAIRELHNKTGYALDPHGAIGYLGCRHHLREGETGIFLETAHPAKFKDVVEQSIGQPIDMPQYLREIQNREKQAVQVPAEYSKFRDWLMSQI